MAHICSKIYDFYTRVVPENRDKCWLPVAMLPMSYPAETLTTLNRFISNG